MEGDKCLFTCVAEGIVEGSWDLFPDRGLAGGREEEAGGQGGGGELGAGVESDRGLAGGREEEAGRGHKEEEVSWEQGLRE